MRATALLFVVAATTAAFLRVEAAPRAAQRRPHRQQTRNAPTPAPKLPCGDVLSFAVLMDRQGFSPGQIEISPTPNFYRAVAAVRAARNLPTGANPDCDTWNALGGDGADPVLTSYVVTDKDIEGPYEPDIPLQIPAQAKLPALEYRSP